jgi:hypothetical protein
MLSLQLSDLVSGGLCVSYDLLMGDGVRARRFIEQVAYRSIGRGVNNYTTLPTVDVPFMSENDLYCGAVSAGDNLVLQGNDAIGTGYEAMRASVSSAGADYVLRALNIQDQKLF